MHVDTDECHKNMELMSSASNQDIASKPEGMWPFVKTITAEGSGITSPVDGAVCSVVIQAKNAPEFGKKLALETFMLIETGEGDSELEGMIDQCLFTMKKEEVSVFQSKLPFEGFNRPCIITINLHHFENPLECFQMSNDQKFEKAKHHKEKGVELFKQENIKGAFKRFSKATKYLILIDQSMEVSEELHTLFCHCYLNLAACQLKFTSAADLVIKNCTKALTFDHESVKGYVRRGQAHLTKGDYTLATQDFRKALNLSPNSKFIKNLLLKSQVDQRGDNQKLSSGQRQ